MDSGMWRRVLLVLVVLGMEGREVKGSNQEVYKKLCDITGILSALLNEEKYSGVTNTLREALYGGNWQDPFVNGHFTGKCGLVYPPSRSTYCSHIGMGGSGATNNHGCFAHSLLGTCLCICVPGNDRKDYCGLGDNVGKGASWISWYDDVNNLFKEVWDKINQNCTARNTTVGASGLLETLENAVEGIKKEAQDRKLNKGYFTLGGTGTSGVCGGTSQGDACVTYAAKNNIPHIPWADKY
ncbi:unnamed protein product [Trypanosoma congolense IL3000]|uniref:WGS project CAEQ00000000 data, annotated contig 1687 n=1 Tax=Trypanosoma congolense (strain IL3000) TaxID=1068625 RepID=F9W808_TRYCI|nr:unnamed protein product [Trypanosoma congolense IL3000]